MEYKEILKRLEGKELSIRCNREFSELSEESSQAELDRFCRLFKEVLKEDPAMLAWQKYKAIRAELRKLHAEEGDTSDIFATLSLAIGTNTGVSVNPFADRIRELEQEASELEPLAREWGRFTNDPEFK